MLAGRYLKKKIPPKALPSQWYKRISIDVHEIHVYTFSIGNRGEYLAYFPLHNAPPWSRYIHVNIAVHEILFECKWIKPDIFLQSPLAIAWLSSFVSWDSSIKKVLTAPYLPWLWWTQPAPEVNLKSLNLSCSGRMILDGHQHHTCIYTALGKTLVLHAKSRRVNEPCSTALRHLSPSARRSTHSLEGVATCRSRRARFARFSTWRSFEARYHDGLPKNEHKIHRCIFCLTLVVLLAKYRSQLVLFPGRRFVRCIISPCSKQWGIVKI